MKIGFYESDVTPPLGLFLPGYFTRRYAKDVLDRLYVKAMVAEDNGKVAAILSLDICEMTEGMSKKIKERITEFTGIRPEDVCVSANHTHYGAPVRGQINLGETPDEAYTDVFCRLAADTVTLAYRRMEESSLFFGKTIVDGISYCRAVELEDGRLITFPRGRKNIKKCISEPDKELGVLFVERDGKKVGALINYALHQDTTGVHGWTGDYSSEISNILKEKYGHDFVSVFVIGCCGDVNHVPHDVEKEILQHRAIGRIVADGVLEIEKAPVPVEESGVDTAYGTIIGRHRTYEEEEYKRRAIDMIQNNKTIPWTLTNLLQHRIGIIPETVDLPVQVIRIGDVGIYIVPGEMFVEFGYKIKAQSPFKHTMVIELANSYSEYIATPECFTEKSELYETAPCVYSNFAPETGDNIVEKAVELGNNIYSKL